MLIGQLNLHAADNAAGGLVRFVVHSAMKQSILKITIAILTLGSPVVAQDQDSNPPEQKPGSVSRAVDHLLNYLNMAGTTKASDFHPLTQRERRDIYVKTMINPLGYVMAGFS